MAAKVAEEFKTVTYANPPMEERRKKKIKLYLMTTGSSTSTTTRWDKVGLGVLSPGTHALFCTCVHGVLYAHVMSWLSDLILLTITR